MVSGNEIPIAPWPSTGSLAHADPTGEVRPLEEMENEIIRFAISHYRGQMSEVARRLKIGRSTLYRKLDEAAANDPAEGDARRELSRRAIVALRVAKIAADQRIGCFGTFEPWLAGDRQRAERRGKTAQSECNRVVRGQFVVSCPAWRWLHDRGTCIVCV